MKNFAIVNDALARMNVNSDNNMPEGDNKRKFKLNSKKITLYDNAPLAAPEDDSDDLAEYAQVKDVYGLDGVIGSTAPDSAIFNFSHDGSSSTNKSNSKLRHRRDKGQSIHYNFGFLLFLLFCTFIWKFVFFFAKLITL